VPRRPPPARLACAEDEDVPPDLPRPGDAAPRARCWARGSCG